MANEDFKFYKRDDICDTRIYFEDWQDQTSGNWIETTQFDTLEECCANTFWWDYEGCVARSPLMFKFDFCVDIQGLVDPHDCQSADVIANVLEDAINDGMYLDHHHSRALVMTSEKGEITTVDANITKIGGVSLIKTPGAMPADGGSTECGGTLAGQSFTNSLTGTTPDIASASNNTHSVCGVITVEEKHCKTEACLTDHYRTIAHELEEFVDLGDLTLAINRRATMRLPPVEALQVVAVVPFTLTTQNLLQPATISGALTLQWYHGSSPHTCNQKSVFSSWEVPFGDLYDCCLAHFGWNTQSIDLCCDQGGGCSGIRRMEEITKAGVAGALRRTHLRPGKH